MKDFEYYETPKDVTYFGHAETSAYELVLRMKIDNTPMTASERLNALDGLRQKVRDHVSEQNKEWRAACAKLKDEFWADAREELGYNKLFNEEGMHRLEGEAWEEGHSYGFSSVYSELERLLDFVKDMMKSAL